MRTTAGAATTCTGTVAVTNSEGQVLGRLSGSGLYSASTDQAQWTHVAPDAAMLGGDTGDLGLVGGSQALGGTVGGYSSYPREKMDTGTADNVYFTAGSSGVAAPNSDYASALWDLDTVTGALVVDWTQPDGSMLPMTGYYDGGYYLGAAADFAAFNSFGGGGATQVGYTLVPDEGAEAACGMAPVDTTAPTASITGGPEDGATVKTAPTYEFTSDEDGSTFECAIDDDAFADCTSPYAVDITDLPDGDHTFSVRATDLADNTGDAASRDFTLDAVDTEAPVTTIDSGPDEGASLESAPTFTFSSSADDVDHFECSLDGMTYTTCTSPYATDVAPGTYTFSVRAVDVNDNVGDPVSRSFTLRNVACEDASTRFYGAKDDVRTAKDKLAAARESGNPKRIERSKERLAAAKDAKNDAKADAVEACGNIPPLEG